MSCFSFRHGSVLRNNPYTLQLPTVSVAHPVIIMSVMHYPRSSATVLCSSTKMPSTDCRAVVLTGPYQVTVKTVAHPSIQTADDAVIQVLYSGLCGAPESGQCSLLT